MTTAKPEPPYAGLTPETILQALEQLGLQPTGALLALNSYENRVYQAELEDREFVVVKFYRPGRWSNAAIREEHQFASELAAAEIPVIAAMEFDGTSLFEFNGYRYAVYPRRGGRWPELDNKDNLELLGRLLGRIHRVGRSASFVHREQLTVKTRGRDALAFLQSSPVLPDELRHNVIAAIEPLLDVIESRFEAVSPGRLRLHGDCHPGNILWTPRGPHFVDLDDCCTGPAMQDLWMLLSGSQDEVASQLMVLLEGYETFSDFDYSEIQLIEPLRGLRLIHYCAWLTRRWHDPAFPHHFPWFNTPRYWEDQIVTFREQLERCDLPPIRLH